MAKKPEIKVSLRDGMVTVDYGDKERTDLRHDG
jgi:hypothetical protein